MAEKVFSREGRPYKALSLGYGMLKKEVTLLSRYHVNTITFFIVLYAIFLMIFIGGRLFGGQAFTDSFGAIIVAYFLASMSYVAFSGLADTISREASWGTLEQLYMTEVGFGTAALLMAIVQALLSFVWGFALLVVMLATTSRTISVDLISVLPIALFGIASVMGVGFILGGAAVLYKRIDNVFNLMQFAFYGLVAMPVESYPILKFLPLAQASYLLRKVMDEGYRIWELPVAELGLLVAVGVGYLVVGYLAFDAIMSVVRKRGVMGHY